MTRYDYGPLDIYEIIWTSGHVEHIEAHQVAPPPSKLLEMIAGRDIRTQHHDGWMFHSMIDGRWKLLLFAHAEDIKSVRNVTHTHDAADGTS